MMVSFTVLEERLIRYRNRYGRYGKSPVEELP